MATVIPTPTFSVAQTGASALQYPIGVRSNAMGQTGVADRWDPDNVYSNPAAVTAVDGVYTTTSYGLLTPAFLAEPWFGHASVGAGRAFGGEKPVLLAFNVTLARLSYGGFDTFFTPWGTLRNYESKEDYFALTAGMAKTFGERWDWALGAAFKRWMADYAPEEFVMDAKVLKFSASMADVGTVVSTTVDASDWRVRPAVGVAVVNLGSDIDLPEDAGTDPLPSWFNYGVAVRVDGPVVALGTADVPAISATLDFDGNHGLNEQDPRWGFGYELSFMQIASVRWGRRIDDHFRTPLATWGVALGVPVGPVRACFEYASVEWSTNVFTYGPSRDVFGMTFAWAFDGRN